MSQEIMNRVEQSCLKADVPEFEIGDTVDVHCLIHEGEKTRTQVFSGTVIARSGSGAREMFVVRRIVACCARVCLSLGILYVEAGEEANGAQHCEEQGSGWILQDRLGGRG